MSGFSTDCATWVQSQVAALRNKFTPEGMMMNGWTRGEIKRESERGYQRKR